jgi:hypothetical protein
VADLVLDRGAGEAASQAGSSDPWLLQSARMAASWNGRLRHMPTRDDYRRLYGRLEDTAAQLRTLAEERRGVAVSVHDCRLDGAPEVSGAACAFRTIRDVMRRGIRVTWAPVRGSGRQGRDVRIELRLSEEGKQRLDELGYPGAGLAFASSRRAPLPAPR